ncbi:hypothetical protein [Dinoroseobacter shibae]|nr:hypothetical protein [Dinoroseobacter shibae]
MLQFIEGVLSGVGRFLAERVWKRFFPSDRKDCKRPAKIAKWRAKPDYNINQAAFLWCGWEPSVREDCVTYAENDSAVFKFIRRKCITLIGEGPTEEFQPLDAVERTVCQDWPGYGLSMTRRDWQRFALYMEELEKLKYPDFLKPRPKSFVGD